MISPLWLYHFYPQDYTVISSGLKAPEAGGLQPNELSDDRPECYSGGVNGVAAVAGAELLSPEPTESMPHALIPQVGDTVKPARLFHEAVPRKVPCLEYFSLS